MSNPSFPPGSSCLPRAFSPRGRPPDLLTVWPALPPAKESRHPAYGAVRGVGGEGQGRQGVEQSDGDGLHDMEVLIQPSESVNPHGVGAVSAETEGRDEMPRKLTFKDMVMGSLIGRVVRIDYNTGEGRRGRFARLAVVVNLTKPLKSRIMIDGFRQPIEYEGLPLICYMCGKYGHTSDTCGSGEIEKGTSARQMGKEKSEMDVYGPWMQAPSRGRRIRQYQKSQGEKGHSNGGANGSRFTILGKQVDGKSVDTDVVAAKLREVIINVGPSASAKGKTVGNVGVGSSKGGMSSGDSHSPMGQILVPSSDVGLVDVEVMRSDALDSISAHGTLLRNKDEQIQVASNGAIHPARTSLKATNHVAVHVSDGGRDGGVVATGEPSYSGPIRKVVTKGAHRFNPKTYLRQRYSVAQKSVKKGPDLESGMGDISCALGEAKGLEEMTESQILSSEGTSVDRVEGVLDPEFRRYFRLLLEVHKSDIVAIFEPRVSGVSADNFIRRSSFDYSYRVEANGFSGGIWLLWRSSVKFSVLAVGSQFIHGFCVDGNNGKSFFVTAVYASPNATKRRSVWEQLRAIQPSESEAWVLGGDFNVICDSSERQGGVLHRYGVCSLFQKFLFRAELFDLGYSGPKFTWRRGSLSQRLDCCLCNKTWFNDLQSSNVVHLQRLCSDHCPILLSTGTGLERRGTRPFRYIDAWCDHGDFVRLVSDSWSTQRDLGDNIENLQSVCKVWNRETFGHIGRRKCRILARIRGVELAIERRRSLRLIDIHASLTEELRRILDQEERLWFQKARCRWIEFGNRNTKYFHATTMARRRQNVIHRLKIDGNSWCDDAVMLRDAAVAYFQRLFSSEPRGGGGSLPVGRFKVKYAAELRPLLNTVSREEVRDVVFSMEPLKAPGIDGFHADWVQQNQASFVPGQCIQDNIIVAQEVIHSMAHKVGKKAWMAIKVDLEKVYDHLEWDFIEETLIDTGLPMRFVSLIMQCVRSVSTHVLWNGNLTERFRPTRGIRQGDPISPYLFVSVSQVEVIKEIIDDFCRNSGHRVSMAKTQITFSKNCSGDVAMDIATRFGFEYVTDLGKYLGVPLLHKRVTKVTYSYLVDQVAKRLTGWAARSLSLAGRITLAKAVLQAIPIYSMQ
ncbi:hypothetical protein GQ457_06G022300 [Hibiscus cannabinus]